MKISFGPGRGTASTQKDIHVEYAPGRRVVPWIRWYVILLLVFSPLFLFLYRSILPWFVVNSQASLAMKKTSVTMPRTGTVIAVIPPVGATVRKGDVLFRIEDDALDARQERLALLRSRLLAMKDSKRARPGRSGTSEEAIALASSILEQAERDRKKVEELLNKRAATEADLRLALQAENRARSDLIRERSDRGALSLEDRRSRDLLRSERRQIEAEIKILESQIAPLDIVSPVDGRILNLNAGPGETLAQGIPLATIVDPNSVSIVVFADNEAFPFIRKDAAVEVLFPGKVSLTARVDRLPSETQAIPGDFATFAGNRRTIRVLLTPVSPVPSEYLIEGLPLIARWGVRLPDLLRRFAGGKGDA